MAARELTAAEIKFMKLLLTPDRLGQVGRIVRQPVSARIESLVARGYCKLSPERLGPLLITTGDMVCLVTEAGQKALQHDEQATEISQA